jgi:hypothetical protein
MRTRLSVPLLRSIAILNYVGAGTLIVIATARDFHLTAFIGGVFFATVAMDVIRFFETNRTR